MDGGLNQLAAAKSKLLHIKKLEKMERCHHLIAKFLFHSGNSIFLCQLYSQNLDLNLEMLTLFVKLKLHWGHMDDPNPHPYWKIRSTKTLYLIYSWRLQLHFLIYVMSSFIWPRNIRIGAMVNVDEPSSTLWQANDGWNFRRWMIETLWETLYRHFTSRYVSTRTHQSDDNKPPH